MPEKGDILLYNNDYYLYTEYIKTNNHYINLRTFEIQTNSKTPDITREGICVANLSNITEVLKNLHDNQD